MQTRHLIIILPLVISSFAILSVYSFITGVWPNVISIYFALACAVTMFSAKQSISIQTMLFWELDDLKTKEKNILGIAITKDFLIYTIVYLAITSAIYFGVYWLLIK